MAVFSALKNKVKKKAAKKKAAPVKKAAVKKASAKKTSAKKAPAKKVAPVKKIAKPAKIELKKTLTAKDVQAISACRRTGNNRSLSIATATTGIVMPESAATTPPRPRPISWLFIASVSEI